MSKPSIPKGTRDFAPQVMARRQWIFDTIRSSFARRGFQAIETPALENLSTLTGKYGEEGDQLIFKVLNNGDFLAKADGQVLDERDSKRLAFQISKKALRYDLTVPFARFVAMHRNELQLPFKRYQIQTVWRGDRPGRGRYQEFTQCDADIIGSEGLLNELELVELFHEALGDLGLPGVRIHMNDRRILAGFAASCGVSERLTDLTVAIDKFDKVGIEGVLRELETQSFSSEVQAAAGQLFAIKGAGTDAMVELEKTFDHPLISAGLADMRQLWNWAAQRGISSPELVFSPGLARGLDYYTGAIFEVRIEDSPVGSVCGGGRYADLTGIFGWKGVSGVGISFGADRIYDVLEHFDAFPDAAACATDVLVMHMGDATLDASLDAAARLRSSGRVVEMYPDSAKLKKQFKYADDRGIAWAVVIGEDEWASKKLTLRNMRTSEQLTLELEEAIKRLC
ncbi:MAG: histidine--tRNA ligase [Flavobacteriales bacterium]|nr:histidine--tRNA ligase [Flavobacteriales bacterium]